LAKRLSNLESCFVLDAGTGAGNMTKVLTDRLSVYVVSADFNRRVFRTVRGRVDRKKVDFIACDFASLPFKDESFRCIICDLVISTSENWRALPIYVEFRRTLRTEDILYITDYYPDGASRNREEKLAAETWKLYRDVSKTRGLKLRGDFPPEQTVKDLEKAGLTNLRKERMTANESARWRKRVFAEYYDGMRRMISGLSDSKLRTRFCNKLETLKKNIVAGREVHWGWGVNYLIEAQK